MAFGHQKKGISDFFLNLKGKKKDTFELRTYYYDILQQKDHAMTSVLVLILLLEREGVEDI